MKAPVVVFAVGNPSRGDDALGPELARLLSAWLQGEGLAGQVEIVEDFQLNIEHALDLQGRKLALFIDAGENTPAPFQFRRIARSAIPSHSTHALPPEAVLQVYWQMESVEAPPAFLLCVRGESFALGQPLSSAAAANLEAARECLVAVLRSVDLGEWEVLADACAIA